jgi:hypothetical protein
VIKNATCFCDIVYDVYRVDSVRLHLVYDRFAAALGLGLGLVLGKFLIPTQPSLSICRSRSFLVPFVFFIDVVGRAVHLLTAK